MDKSYPSLLHRFAVSMRAGAREHRDAVLALHDYLEDAARTVADATDIVAQLDNPFDEKQARECAARLRQVDPGVVKAVLLGWLEHPRESFVPADRKECAL